MKRRSFLKNSTGVFLSGSFLRTAEPSSSSTPPRIPQATLDKYGWEKVGNPSLSLPSDKANSDINTSYTAFRSRSLDEDVSNAINSEIGLSLMPMLAIRVENNGLLSWPIGSKLREVGEPFSGIDGETEEVFERYFDRQVNGGNFNLVAEAHVKSFTDVSSYVVSQVPYVGELLAGGIDYLWDAETSIKPATGGESYLSQYFAEYPLTEDSVKPSIVNEETIDYRGWYADWFDGESFYAVGGLFPQDQETLLEALETAFDEKLTLPAREMSYEDEVLRVISSVE